MTAGRSPADEFRRLHRAGRPLLLPNAWDFASAAVLARAGFRAIGTTSLGVAAGKADAAGRTKQETVTLARAIAALGLVTVDIEAGFSSEPAKVAELAGALAAVGVVGVNIEDGRGTTLARPERQAELIASAVCECPHRRLLARVADRAGGDAAASRLLLGGRRRRDLHPGTWRRTVDRQVRGGGRRAA